MRDQGNRAIRVFVFALVLAISLASSAAGAGEVRNPRPTVTAEQAPVLLFLLTALLTAARIKSMDAATMISDPATLEQAPVLLYADAEDAKDWMRGSN